MTAAPEFLNRKIFRIVSSVAAAKGVRAFVIGGYVRDCFLGRPCDDIDIVVEGSGIDFAKDVGARTGKYVSYFKNFGTAMLHYEGAEVEFVGARKESYRRDSRKPIVENGTLEDDQLRRDFTINAMAFSLNEGSFGELVDPFGGVRDLAAGIIRTPLDPDTTYSDDPLRMLRAVRFATKLSTPELTFRIVPESIESMRRMADRIKILSAERVAEEVSKMLMTPRPSMAFRLLDEAGLLPYILPELSALKGVETIDGRGHKDNFEHSIAVLDNIVASGVTHTPAALDNLVASGETKGALSGASPVPPAGAGASLASAGDGVGASAEECRGDAPEVIYASMTMSEGALSGASKDEVSETTLPLRWAALLHDIGKPASKRYEKGVGWTFHGHEIIGSKMVPAIFKRLKLSLDDMKYVKKLVWLHLRPIALVDEEVTDSAVRRLLFDAGDDIDDLMALCNADITSKNPAKVARVKANFELVKRKLIDVEARDAVRNFKNPITGEYVMEVYGIPPCREIGLLKEAVKEAILDGVIPNEFAAADRYMRELAPSLGLTAR